MADFLPVPAHFKGTSGEDCEIFVAMIRRRALEQGKQRDREWMAIFAFSCLIGDALYWYEGLDETVQNDWTRLRPALLERFGRSGPPTSATSSIPAVLASAPLAAIPIPAAAPPTSGSRALARIGRLRVVTASGGFRGYVSEAGDTGGLCRTLSTSPDDALLISFTTSPPRQAFVIQIIDDQRNPQTIDSLAICWEDVAKGQWLHYATVAASSCFFSKISSSNFWCIEKKVWTISKSGELSVEYPHPDGGTEKLQPCLNPFDRHIQWVRVSSSDYERVRILVQDVM